MLLHFFPGDIRECKTSTELIFDIHAGSEHGDEFLPCIQSLVLGEVCLPTAYTLLAVVVLLRGIVTAVRGKAVRVTFGIKNANKKMRNNKSPFKGEDTVFFLTRDLSADAPADSKEYKGEVNRGNRKKRVALNNKVFFVLYNLFYLQPVSGPYVLWERPMSSCSMPPS